MPDLKVVSEYQPAGDQPQAIDKLAQGLENGLRAQVLKGVTGSGKTYTMAKVIERVNRPTLVLAHNKTLAAQLCEEFREFFPNNAVEYFVSYYDYYQPEAYVPQTDTYIEKDASTNEEIDRLRLSATCALLERRDVIVVASVSCIYGLGEPDDFARMMISLRTGMTLERDELLRRLVEDRYERNDVAFQRNVFRVRGDTVELYPAYYKDRAIRVEFFGDEIERITEFHPVTGAALKQLTHVAVYPASHYVTPKDKLERAAKEIERELAERKKWFEDNGKLIEAQRIDQRTRYDVEMMRTLGYCSGIENYSRVISQRPVGSAPMTLLDFFPEDFVLFVDESHVTLPQVRAMYNGDHARKQSLVDYGFRLPCAFDNRPLKFEEFEERFSQAVFVSATPGDFEKQQADQIVEQVIRPTGLLDPRVEVRPVLGQIDDLVAEIHARAEKNERVLVTTLTKKMAEDLTAHFRGLGIKVRYMHADVSALERMEIIRDLRLGEFDVLVGINLLREGLDLPEVSLVAILDADKEGFLRSETSLIQTIGRAARNAEGLVILYADTITPSMRAAMDETERRRKLQDDFNKAHGIIPQTIRKSVREMVEISHSAEEASKLSKKKLSDRERAETIARLEKEMKEASRMLACCVTRSSSCGVRNKPNRERVYEKVHFLYLRDPQRRVLGLYRFFQPYAHGGGRIAGQPGVHPELRHAGDPDHRVRPVPPSGVPHQAEASAHLPVLRTAQHPGVEPGLLPVPDHVLPVGGGGAAVSGPVLCGHFQHRAVEDTADEAQAHRPGGVPAGMRDGQRHHRRRYDRLLGGYRSGRAVRPVLRQLYGVCPLRSGPLRELYHDLLDISGGGAWLGIFRGLRDAAAGLFRHAGHRGRVRCGDRGHGAALYLLYEGA